MVVAISGAELQGDLSKKTRPLAEGPQNLKEAVKLNLEEILRTARQPKESKAHTSGP